MPRDNLVLAVDWFEPKAVLAAADEPVPLPRGEDRAADFEPAIRYSDGAASSALLIWQGGRLQVERYAEGFGPDDRTQSQSMHKSVLALAVALALDEGDIASLDDPADKYLENWIAQPYGRITLRHLITMSSGLALTPVGESGENSFANRLLNASDIDRVAKSAPQVRAPGEVFEYNNVNPQLLLSVLEAATGQPYEQFLSERLWSNLAEDEAYLWMDRPDGKPHGYCCMIATPRDWLRLGLLVLGNGTVASRELISTQRIVEATDPSATNRNYGHYIWRGTPYEPVRNYRPSGVFGTKHSAPFLAPDTLFFDGYGGQRVYIVPSRDLVIVRVGRVSHDWDDAILPNAVLASLDAQLDQRSFVDCEGCPRMRRLPPGEVTLGSDIAEAERYDVPDDYALRKRPRMDVEIADAFAISITEITNAQFARFVEAASYVVEPGCWIFRGNKWNFETDATWRDPGIETGPDHPVTCVNAADGEAYAAWLSQITGHQYRLPSEAEWEYATRAGTSGATYWNGSQADLCLFANMGDRSTERMYRWEQVPPYSEEYRWRGAACDDGYAALAPVASFGPNAFGLYDMIGNVNEWTGDCFSESHSDHPASQAPWNPAGCEMRLLKGHTWTGNERTARAAFRLRLDPSDRRFNLGLRVVRSIDSERPSR